MSSFAERAQSFGSIATNYDRLRPSAPPEAVDWLVPSGAVTAVDVAAGTGLFTRLLAERVPKVYAVEPDDRMREVLAQRSPGVTVLKGTGEQIPLPDASVDAVYVSSAWHWLDESRAVPETARVLRDGGRLGVLWTARDRDIEWVRDLDRLPGQPLMDPAAEDRHRWRRDVGVEGDARFTNVARANFAFTRPMLLDDAVAMIATYSRVITASRADRDAVLSRAHEMLRERFGDVAEVDFPMRARCWRGDRIAR
jgi:SAM-dependent methyltransferase